RAAGAEPLAGPVRLELAFVRVPPRDHFGARGVLRPSAPALPTTARDPHKPGRRGAHALTRVCYVAHAPVTKLIALQRWGPVAGGRRGGPVGGVEVAVGADEAGEVAQAPDATLPLFAERAS